MISEVVEDFRSAMRARGIDYTGEICCDGRLHRFKSGEDRARNSWYVFYAEPPPFAGAFGCWKRGLKETWCASNGSLSQADHQGVRERWGEADAKQKLETFVRQKK